MFAAGPSAVGQTFRHTADEGGASGSFLPLVIVVVTTLDARRKGEGMSAVRAVREICVQEEEVTKEKTKEEV